MPPYDYLLRLLDKDGGKNIEVSGAIPRVGERVRIITKDTAYRYYEVRDVLHTVLEEKIDINHLPHPNGESKPPQVFALRKED